MITPQILLAIIRRNRSHELPLRPRPPVVLSVHVALGLTGALGGRVLEHYLLAPGRAKPDFRRSLGSLAFILAMYRPPRR